MSFIIQHYHITGRLYYQLESSIIDQELADMVDFNNLLIASHNGTVRFLLNDGTLVMVKTDNPIEVYTSLMAYAPSPMMISTAELQNNTFTVSFTDIHASIHIDCANCDNGTSHNYYYDFSPSGRIMKGIPSTTAAVTIDMNFHLTSHQASNVVMAASSLYDLNQRGLYKYIPYFQDCASVPIDTYRNSGLPHHLASFYTDSELLDNSILPASITFKDKLYHVHDLSDPTRSEASAFMKEVYGNDYAEVWNTDFGNGTISELQVDTEAAMANPIIKARIERLTDLRKEYYSEFVKIWGQGFNITEEHIKPFIERGFTNEELYYTYTTKFELEQHKLLTQLPYAPYLKLAPFGTDILKSCYTEANPLYAPICQAACDQLHNAILDEDNKGAAEKFCNKWADDSICPFVEENPYSIEYDSYS